MSMIPLRTVSTILYITVVGLAGMLAFGWWVVSSVRGAG